MAVVLSNDLLDRIGGLFGLLLYAMFGVYVMDMKGFLRRRYFTIANGLYIVLNLSLAVYIALIEREKLLITVIFGCFNLFVCVMTFGLCIHKISIENMMYAAYIGVGNALILILKALFSVLIDFKSKNPYKVVFENVPVCTVSGISLLYSLYMAYMRKCIVDGLVYPVFMQRRKKIESRVVLVRREYPEIFSVQ